MLDAIKISNYLNTSFPNVLHFQGKGYLHYCVLFDHFANQKLEGYTSSLSIVTCATDESKSPLIRQLKLSNIPYINAVNSQYYTYWVNTMKIPYILSSLKSIKTEYTLILDGYDVAIQTISDIVDKFISTNKHIVFNATKHNYPRLLIDKVPNRDFRGDFGYFNAGCCIGYTKDLIDFYTVANDILSKEPTNQWNSEQYIIRKTFANYSEQIDKDNYIDYDSQCNIFQTFGSTKLEKTEIENVYKVV